MHAKLTCGQLKKGQICMFLVEGRPTVTTMLKSDSPEELIKEIAEIKAFGTDTLGLQIEAMKPEYRNKESLQRVYAAAGDMPIYVTNYRGGDPNADDEKLAEGLLEAAACGKSLLDMRADMFAPCAGEFTTDLTAVSKQIEFIRKAHAQGSEVLMSTHILDRFVPKAEVKKIAHAAHARGADISKIVTTANAPEELQQNLELLVELKEEMPIPFLFLCGGSHCRIHRIYGPTMGACMYLAAVRENGRGNQPYLSDVKTAMTLAGYENLPFREI